jgi:hypothetical protein
MCLNSSCDNLFMITEIKFLNKNYLVKIKNQPNFQFKKDIKIAYIEILKYLRFIFFYSFNKKNKKFILMQTI